MALADPPLTDTRFLFRPVSTALVRVLRDLTPADWTRPTVAGTWTVRDIVAHLADGALRRVSFQRDRHPPPPPKQAIANERDFVRFINGLNAEWVSVAGRFSPPVLIDLYVHASEALADWFERLPLDAPALFPVSWAGEAQSAGWFDLGREFTEVWHHQQQIRMAVGAPGLDDPRYLRAVLDIAMRGLPHAFREIGGHAGETVVIDVSGPAGSQWTLVREEPHWALKAGVPPDPTTVVTLEDDVAWRLLFNAIPPAEAPPRLRIDGKRELAAPLLHARSVIV